MSDFSKQRLLGLDIVRSFAILCVLVAHGLWVLANPADHLALRFGGQFGVELFFVLSGFLIGTILLKICDSDGLRARTLGYFWVRRWMRTVPAYIAVLLFIAIVLGRFDPAYFVFMQGVLRDDFAVLPVSWSLVIEEWFYLFFPVLCLMTLALCPKRGFLYAALLLLSVPMVYHLFVYHDCAVPELRGCFERQVRKSGLRFTTIAIGAILAYIHARYDLRQMLKGRLLPLGLLTAAVFAATLAYTLDLLLHFPGNLLPAGMGLFLLYPLMGISGALIVALFYVWQPPLPGWMGRGFYFISLTSYSNYLWHMLIRDALTERFPAGWPLFVMYMLASLLAAGLFYWLTERPFLLLRRRWTKE